MNQKLKIGLSVAVLVALVGVGVAIAVSTGPQITWDVIGGGGGMSTGTISGTPVVLMDTIGQPVVDVSSGGNVKIGSGFWYLLAVNYGVFLPMITR
jgi:hypothetical protein